MAEFISAKDLPVTEEEEVDVLCVNPTTGEMCRKAKTTFSGNGNEYDLVLCDDVGKLYIMSGSCEAVLNKMINHELPRVFIYGNEDLDYVYCPNKFCIAPTLPDDVYITFDNYSIPGGPTVAFGINNSKGTLNALMTINNGTNIWAEVYGN